MNATSSLRRAGALLAGAAVLVGALAGCTAGTGTTPAPSTGAAPTTTPAPAGPENADETTVARVVEDFQNAMASGDFAGACGAFTDEAAAQLVATVNAATPPVDPAAPPLDCPTALGRVLGQTGAPEAATEAAASLRVTDVTIDGLTATVRWTSTREQVVRQDAVRLQSVAGFWRVAGPA